MVPVAFTVWATPGSFTERGTDVTAGRAVHLHEAHHAALNDSTAWGSALHILARLPDVSDHHEQPVPDLQPAYVD